MQQKAESIFVESGRQDILVVAMGKAEHPGRVRGVGGGIGIRDYFGSSPRSRGDSVSRGEMQHAIDAVHNALQQTVSQNAQTAVQQTLSMMFNVMQTGQLSQTVDPNMQDMFTTHPIFTHLLPVSQQISTQISKSDKSSCSPHPSQDTFTEGQKCSLLIMDPDRRVLAYVSLSMSRIFHCVELDDHLVRVRIEQLVVDDARLPCPDKDDEITLIRDAQGLFVAWPRYLIDAVTSVASHHSKRKEVSLSHSSSCVRKNLNMHDLKQMISIIFTSSDAIQTITMPIEVVGRSYSYVLGRSDIEEMLNMDLLDTSIMQIDIMSLYDLAEEIGQKAYGFLSPVFFTEDLSSNHRVEYLTQHMKESKKEFYLLLIIRSAHWMLVVIWPRMNKVYWLCSIGKIPPPLIKVEINNAMSGCMYRVGRTTKPKWIRCNSRRQSDSTACGYFVLRYMFEIVTEGLSAVDDGPRVINEHFNNKEPYTQDELDEIRERLTLYLQGLLELS